jgi:hypothetical protein
MNDYNNALCEERHSSIKEKFQTVDKKLEVHDEQINDMKEVVLELRDLNKRMIDKQNDNTAVKTSNRALWGVVIASFLTSASSIIVVLVK